MPNAERENWSSVNEPDWSDLTLVELLEKAQEFGNKAYSSFLSIYAFLERTMEAGKKYSTSTMEIADLATKTRQAFQLLAEVNSDLKRFAPQDPSPQSNKKIVIAFLLLLYVSMRVGPGSPLQ